MVERVRSAVFDHRRHFGEERVRMLELLTALLRTQRSRGRSPAADALAGLVIEDGEAEGLVQELEGAWRVGGRTAASDADAFAELREAVATRAGDASARGVPLPLWHARRMFGLEPDEYDALVLALLVECDARVGRLASYLNDHVARDRPTVGLVSAIADLQGIASDPLTWPERPVLTDALLTLEGDGPLPGRAIRIDQLQARRLTSLDPTPEPTLRVTAPDPFLLERLVLPDTLRDRVAAWVEAIRAGDGTPVVVVAGPEGGGRSTLARAAASAVGRPLVESVEPAEPPWASLALMRREARWYGAAMLIRFRSDGAAGADFWRALGTPPGLLFLETPEPLLSEVLGSAPAEPLLWRCAAPGTTARTELWQRLLPPGCRLDERDAEMLAAAFRFGPGAVTRAVRRADAERGTRPLDRAALAEAAREHVGQALHRLADRLPLPYTRDDLVVPLDIEQELELALAWMRHQAQVLDRWALGRRVASGRGLTALFAGPPGTGKTMAAQVLSRELELDCYRIDLSRVVSKYIGETEQNLARVFDEAEAGGAVLFFDEADALFGKRSEVRDARDRYANLEVGYLLQRMEHYDGVAVLATNRMADMDEAFLRRFQVVARFRLPVAHERRRIWAGLLPDECERSADVNLDGLADAVEFSGGEIKNCVLAAAYLAAAEGEPIGMAHLLASVRRELAKLGRVVDETALQRLAAL